MIALNNNGNNSLRFGRYQDAILSFRHAMECAKSLMVIDQEELMNGCCSVNDDAVALIHVPLDCVDASAVSPNNMFDVYQGAFSFRKTDEAALKENLVEASVVLLYNLALTHHVAGLFGTEHLEAHLGEALSYYKGALATYRNLPSTMLCTTLVLGCVTNMGHVYSHFWRTKEAKSCMEMIERMLQSPDVMQLSEEDGEFFFSTPSYGSAHYAGLLMAPAA